MFVTPEIKSEEDETFIGGNSISYFLSVSHATPPSCLPPHGSKDTKSSHLVPLCAEKHLRRAGFDRKKVDHAARVKHHFLLLTTALIRFVVLRSCISLD